MSQQNRIDKEKHKSHQREDKPRKSGRKEHKEEDKNKDKKRYFRL
ncbi:unnamed protein product [marine sediment metagenome]|uniref:Uncharacterized protein n=1 Tax=marine sediment metagenome TaxID=412755 RepID=X0T074_9ZZZZ